MLTLARTLKHRVSEALIASLRRHGHHGACTLHGLEHVRVLSFIETRPLPSFMRDRKSGTSQPLLLIKQLHDCLLWTGMSTIDSIDFLGTLLGERI